MIKINTTELEILKVLLGEKISMGNLAKRVNVAPVNLWKRVQHLEEIKLLENPKVQKGKRKYLFLPNRKKVERIVFLYNSLQEELSPTSQTSPNGDFSNGKEHNISLKDNSHEDSQISSNDETSLNNNIHEHETSLTEVKHGAR